MTDNLKKILAALLLVLLAVLSITFFAEKRADVSTYAETITSLDEKAKTVLKLSAASTLSSTVLSAIPDDTATPIAEKLADFSEYFLIVLCVLYAEKYLLTLLGAAAFKLLIPLACAAGIAALFMKNKKVLKLMMKFLAVGLILSFIIPISVQISDMIYGTYQLSIDAAIDEAQSYSKEAEGFTEEDKEKDSGFLSSLTGAMSTILDKGAKVLNSFVEALAVIIVTTCVIPIVVLIFFIWLIRQFLGLEKQDSGGSKGKGGYPKLTGQSGSSSDPKTPAAPEFSLQSEAGSQPEISE